MRVGVVRVSLVIAACLLWLVGCETQTKIGDLWKRDGASASDPATTGSLLTPNATGPSSNAGMLGSDPYDDLNHGKRFYREGADARGDTDVGDTDIGDADIGTGIGAWRGSNGDSGTGRRDGAREQS